MDNYKWLEVTIKTEVASRELQEYKDKGIKVKIDSKGRKYATLRQPLVKLSPEDFDRVNLHRWCVNSAGYVFRWEVHGEKLKSIYLQKEILKTKSGQFVSFKDGDKWNLTRENLLALSRTQLMHRKRRKEKADTKYKGIFWSEPSSKWHVNITDVKRIHCGSFLSEEFAAQVYDFYARRIYGAVADVNFPDIKLTEKEIKAKLIEESTKSSKYRGVVYMKAIGRYRARVSQNKVLYDLGSQYQTEDEANIACIAKRKELGIGA
jgi:hypothetical protein